MSKILSADASWAYRDPKRREKYDIVERLYSESWLGEGGDFSERLLKQVDRVAAEFWKLQETGSSQRLTETLFKGDIRALSDAVGEYIEEKREVWLLVDNLDKGWPTRGASETDILILRTLLEATGKLQRELDRHNVIFHCLVFLRNDIHDFLIRETPDKGKETSITLDWADSELFKRVFLLRAMSPGQASGAFDEAWAAVFEPNVGTRDSVEFVLERTLMRPRECFMFVHRVIEAAINRGHARVTQEDLKKAEETLLDDMHKAMVSDLEGAWPVSPEFIYGFIGCAESLPEEDVKLL